MDGARAEPGLAADPVHDRAQGDLQPVPLLRPTVNDYIAQIQNGDAATQAAVAKKLNKYIVEQAWFAPWYRVQGNFATDANTTVTVMSTNAYPAIYDIKPKQ